MSIDLTQDFFTLFGLPRRYALDDAALEAYLVTTLPMMFGEGFFCGGAMALIVVYRPQWCASFDDARYLHSR